MNEQLFAEKRQFLEERATMQYEKDAHARNVGHLRNIIGTVFVAIKSV